LCIEIEANLGTGAKVEITLPREAIIFGEVRYCRRTAPGYQAGIFIEDVFYAHRADTGEHIHDDTLSHYLESKGLGAREILSVRDHLLHCNLCSARYDVVAKLQDRHDAAAMDR
jgi:hypothetical protein